MLPEDPIPLFGILVYYNLRSILRSQSIRLFLVIFGRMRNDSLIVWLHAMFVGIRKNRTNSMRENHTDWHVQSATIGGADICIRVKDYILSDSIARRCYNAYYYFSVQ